MFTLRHIFVLVSALFCFLLVDSAPLLAQQYHSFSFSISPFSLGRQLPARFEYNLNGKATLSLEATYIQKGEELNKSEIDNKPGVSMMTQGKQGAILISRYTEPFTMSGFFWSLGAGYRVIDSEWKKPLQESEERSQEYLGLLDTDGNMTHKYTASGVTGHLRGGYRYVGESVPLSIGGYIGVRHFQNKVEDKIKDEKEPDPEISRLTEEEKTSIRHRFNTALEASIGFGVLF